MDPAALKSHIAAGAPLHSCSRGHHSLIVESFPVGSASYGSQGHRSSSSMGSIHRAWLVHPCVCVSQLILHSLTCYEELVTFLQQSIHQVRTMV